MYLKLPLFVMILVILLITIAQAATIDTRPSYFHYTLSSGEEARVTLSQNQQGNHLSIYEYEFSMMIKPLPNIPDTYESNELPKSVNSNSAKELKKVILSFNKNSYESVCPAKTAGILYHYFYNEDLFPTSFSCLKEGSAPYPPPSSQQGSRHPDPFAKQNMINSFLFWLHSRPR